MSRYDLDLRPLWPWKFVVHRSLSFQTRTAQRQVVSKGKGWASCLGKIIRLYLRPNLWYTFIWHPPSKNPQRGNMFSSMPSDRCSLTPISRDAIPPYSVEGFLTADVVKRCESVRLSVCLSHSWVTSKRFKISKYALHDTIEMFLVY